MKNLHDIIQKNMETFDEMVDHSPESYYQGFVGKDGTKYENVLSGKKVIKSHLLSSQLSIIQAIDECVESKKGIERDISEARGERETELLIIFQKGKNSALSDLRSFLNTKTKLQ